MPRMSNIAQYELVETGLVTKMLEGDDPDELPILPAHLGGSFLYEIEDIYDDVILALASMNSQQIADTVNQMFLTVNMSGMPPAQRQAYIRGLEGLLKIMRLMSVMLYQVVKQSGILLFTCFQYLMKTSSKSSG